MVFRTHSRIEADVDMLEEDAIRATEGPQLGDDSDEWIDGPAAVT